MEPIANCGRPRRKAAIAALWIALGASSPIAAQAQSAPSFPMGLGVLFSANPDLTRQALQMVADWPADDPDSRAAWRAPLASPPAKTTAKTSSPAKGPRRSERANAVAAQASEPKQPQAPLAQEPKPE